MAIISEKIKTIKKAANNVSVRGSFSPFLFLFVSKKGTFYLSVNVFSTKVLIGDTIFLRLLMETGPPFYVVIRATERSRRLQCKGSTFISQLFLRP